MTRPAVACILALILSAPPALAADSGLIGHWNFDEGKGAVARDASGNNNHGALVGDCKYVKGVRGTALSFGGKKTWVEIPNTPSLNFEGDMTLAAWVRTDGRNDEGRDRLIYGDAASLAVKRHLSVGLDKGTLFLGHGNGAEYESITSGTSFEGQWKHLAVVYEYPRTYLYVDGRIDQIAPMTFPVSPTQGANRFIGGWWAGRFKGDIDDVRLYRRALTEREILVDLLGQAGLPAPAASITPQIIFARNELNLDILCRNISARAVSVRIRLISPRQKDPIAVATAQLEHTRPDSERATGRTGIDIAAVPPGRYKLALTGLDRNGASLMETARDFEIPPTPAWVNSTAGITDDVLPPFTPMEIAKVRGGTTLSVWGRDYHFTKTPFLSQITTREQKILAAPMHLVAKVNGKTVAWRARAPKFDGNPTPAKVALRQTGKGGPLSLTVNSQAEYDGFVKFDCTLATRRTTKVQQLVLTVPFNAPNAEYLYTWPTVWGGTGYSGTLKALHAFEFKPIVWIGDNERGLSWYCESDEGWSNADPKKAMQVLRTPDGVLLKLNLVTRPVTLRAGSPLKYTFAFQATPLRPVDKDGWDYRVAGSPWYGHDYDMLTKELFDKPAIEYLASRGVRTLITGNWTNTITYPWPVGRERVFKDLVDACHRNGIQVIPYHGYQISEQAPEYRFVRDEVVRIPISQNPDKYPDMEPQLVSIVCLRSSWQDCLVYNIARMVDEFDIDGVYLDSTAMPFPCKNTLHGCGYRRPDGTTAPTYPVFDVRSLFKRLYTVIKQRKRDGIVDAHVYDGMNGAALAFSTSLWTGEQLKEAKHPPDGLPLDRFRAEMMGHNWGVPADFLHYKLGGHKKAHAITLIHDVPVRAYAGEYNLSPSAEIWKLAEDFDRKGARFLPYWSNTQLLSGLPEQCYASLYHHPENGLLVIVSNLGREDVQGAATLDLEKLGLAGTPLAAVDGLTRKPAALEGNVIRFALPPMGWQYIWLKPGALR